MGPFCKQINCVYLQLFSETIISSNHLLQLDYKVEKHNTRMVQLKTVHMHRHRPCRAMLWQVWSVLCIDVLDHLKPEEHHHSGLGL